MTASEQGGFPLQLSLLLVCSVVIVAGGGSGSGQGYIFDFCLSSFACLSVSVSYLSLSLCVTDWGRGAKNNNSTTNKGVDGLTNIKAKSVQFASASEGRDGETRPDSLQERIGSRYEGLSR